MSNPLYDRVSKELLTQYVLYTKERAAVYHKKEVLKLPPPWTDHPHISQFYFTNVKRYLDKQSKWVIDNVVNNSSLSSQSKALNIALFSMINRGDSYTERFGKILHLNEMTFEEILQVGLVEAELASEYKTPVQSNAYFLSSAASAANKIVPKEIAYTNSARAWLCKENVGLIHNAFISETAEDAMNYLSLVPALGPFLAYQVLSTMSYCEEVSYSDNEYVSCGPGTKQGIWRLLSDNNPAEGFEDFVHWFQSNITGLCEYYGLEWRLEDWLHFLPEHQRIWTLQDITNSFCELAKLYKQINNIPMRPRWYPFHKLEN